MLMSMRRRVLVAALFFAVSAASASGQTPAIELPKVEVEQAGANELPPDLPEFLPGEEAVDRLISPALVPLPGIESFGWFAEFPVPPASAAPVYDPCAPCPAACMPNFGGPLCSRGYLLGDWGGLRSRLACRGVNFDLYQTNFYSQVFNGGLQETAQYRGRMDALVSINGERAGLWRGFFIDMHGEAIWGNSINQYTGTLLPVSLAQHVPVQNGAVAALTGVKFTQFLNDQIMVYGGKLNVLDEYRQPFTGGSRGVDGFWNTAFLFNPVLARTLPYSSYAFGAAVVRNLETIASFTVFDANNTPTTTGFNTFFDNGVVLVPSINIPTRFRGLPGHQGLTATWSSRKYFDNEPSPFLNTVGSQVGPGALRDGAWSLAYNFDQAVFVSPCDPCRMWGAFGNFGIADNGPSPVRWFASLGVGGSSPIDRRPLDTFGLGYFYLGVSSAFQDLSPPASHLRDEHGLEAFYNFAVTPWCRITPDVQFILPAQRLAEHMWFFGLRAKMIF